MHFLVSFTIPGGLQNRIISANSWSSCLSYCEGTGLYFRNITDLSTAIINYASPGTNCYQISALDENGINVSAFVWESNFDAVTVWIDSQNFQKVNSILLSNNSYVIV